MMTIMAKTAGKGLADQQNRTAEENAMLDMLQNGGSRVSEENLQAVLSWYETQQIKSSGEESNPV